MLKKKMEKLVKDDRVIKAELNKVKQENEKICAEIGRLQFDKDKVEAQVKAKEKLSKIKENTKLFNRIIQNQIDDGSVVNVDISKYEEKADAMEGDNDGFGNDSLDLDRLRKDMRKGGRRTSPQEYPEIIQSGEKEQIRGIQCSKCDFVSLNEIILNEHMTKVHSGQPCCPFCEEALQRKTSGE